MTTGAIRRIALIGVGIMGSGMAAEWAAAGHAVTIYARDEERLARGQERVAAALRTLGGAGLLDAGGAETALARVGTTTDLQQSVAGADLVQESIPENLDLKRELFTKLDSWCPPETILATNTSGLPITQIAEGLAGARRIIGVHYLNPAYLMPPVEVIPGEATAPEVVERMRAALIALGKSPLVVRREVPGFLWNRLQFALVREAFWLVQEGVATMEEVDLAIRQGLGRRWATAGPFALDGPGRTRHLQQRRELPLPPPQQRRHRARFPPRADRGGLLRREERQRLLRLARRQARGNRRPPQRRAARRPARRPGRES
ncbi:MAG: 3-hydroxyacyl-CoA dehydrogenase family protein [Thermomicrobiales bacterium]